MKEIATLVRAVRRRLQVNMFLAHVGDAAFISAICIAGFVFAVKLVFLPNALAYIAWATAAGALVSILYALARSRLGVLSAALAADKGLVLAERLSTALMVSAEDGAMGRAVLVDARRCAASARYREKFRIRLPDRWWRAASAVAALAVVLALPQFDLLGRQALREAKKREREEVARQIDKAAKQLEQFKKSVSKGDIDAIKLIQSWDEQLRELGKQDLGKKETLAALSQMMKQLADMAKESAKSIAEKRQEATAAMAQAMDLNALKRAADQMAKIQDALKAGELDAGKNMELSKALSDLAKTLAEQAQKAQAEAEKKSQQAGQEGMSAEDAQKLAEALKQLAEAAQKNQQLSQQLQQMAQQMAGGLNAQSLASMQSALSAMQSDLAGMLGDISGAEMAQQIASMAEALSGMQQFNSDLTGEGSMTLDEAIAALNSLSAGMRQGQGGRGLGMGGPGIGEGNIFPLSEVDTDTQAEKLSGDMRKGKVIASYFTEGGMLKNDSVVEYEEMVLSSDEEAKEALSSARIPKAYRTAVKTYFDSLKVPDETPSATP